MPRTTYERWFWDNFDPATSRSITQAGEVAFALGEWLDGRMPGLFPIPRPTEELTASVFSIDEDNVIARLADRLNQNLPCDLIPRVLHRVYASLPRRRVLDGMLDGFDLAWLVGVLNESYAAEDYRRPTCSSEIKSVGTLVSHINHPLLRTAYTSWTGRASQVSVELAKLSDADYGRFVHHAVRSGIVSLDSLLVEGRGRAFVNAVTANLTPTSRDLVSLVTLLVDRGEIASLSGLTRWLGQASLKDLGTIQRLLDHQFAVPSDFRTSLMDACEAAAASRRNEGWSFWSWWR